jgi:RNA polymerase sigma-B factor
LTEEFDAMAAAMPGGLAAAGDPDGPDLGPAGLGGSGLDGAGLDKAALERADLDGADLDGADLETADLETAGLESTDLESRNPERADLDSADLDAADLDGAEVSRSDPGSSGPSSTGAVKPDTESPRIQHGTRERSHARELFERISELPADDEERLRIRGELVELHLPLVEYLARRFRNRGEWLDDLTQVATIGLIKSIDRFDLERGVEFSTYATPTIVGEIKRHFRDKGWAVRVPRRLQELKLALTKAIGDLAQRLGRAPTVAELAAHLQMSEEDVLEGLESANAYSTVSLDAPDSGDEDAPAVAESLGMVDDALEGVEYRESLKPLLERLPPREKRILLLRFFGNMTQSQIATELGISQMHVSRLLAKTLAQLREGLTTDD